MDSLIADYQKKGLLFHGAEGETPPQLKSSLMKDIEDAEYSLQVEQGILQFYRRCQHPSDPGPGASYQKSTRQNLHRQRMAEFQETEAELEPFMAGVRAALKKPPLPKTPAK